MVLMGAQTDPRIAWMLKLGKRYELAWPTGYSARFVPGLEVLDETGKVVARQGDELLDACPSADPNVLVPVLPSAQWPQGT